MNAIDRLDQAAYEMYSALQVIVLDRNINDFLGKNDPKALQQCKLSMQTYLNRNNKEWMTENRPERYWEL